MSALEKRLEEEEPSVWRMVGGLYNCTTCNTLHANAANVRRHQRSGLHRKPRAAKQLECLLSDEPGSWRMQDDRFLCMPCDRHFGTYSYARQHQTTEGHKAKLAPEQPALAAGDLPREVQDALALLSHMCPVADSPLADTEPDIPRIVEQYREWFEDRKAMGCAVCGTFCAQHVTEYSIALFPRLQVRSTFHVQHSGLLHVVSHGGTLYHLDAEYVDAEAGTFQACDSCSYGLKTKDGKPPACSFAAGTDFGRDLGLPDLTVVERFLIARTVSFATLLKIRLPRTGVSAPFTGHSIAYAHTGPQSLGRLPRTDAAEAITVLFVGPSADASKTRAGLKKLCEVRPPVVLQWLRFLRKHNEKYADIQIAEDVSHLEGLADSIVDGMVCIEEEDSVRIDKAAGSSNQQPDDTTAPQHGSIEHVLVDEPVHQDALQDMMRHCRTMAAHARGAAAHARDVEGEDDPRPTRKTTHARLHTRAMSRGRTTRDPHRKTTHARLHTRAMSRGRTTRDPHRKTTHAPGARLHTPAMSTGRTTRNPDRDLFASRPSLRR
ncbi:hypothetical protein DIPPA_33499 [Diplonema papillatum]|nr:hypothetical protein DIPPA_33499 [Diplonema papillatum]